MPRHWLFILSVAVMGLAGCKEHSVNPTAAKKLQIARGEIGSQLPEFSLKDLQGHKILSAELRGKVVLVDFWATWCQPCKKEMPGYQELLNRYGTRGFVVIGFKFDTMPDVE